MLVVFFVAITPKQYLHFVFAEHRDSTTKIQDQHNDVLSKGGFHCNCDNIVAESPFLSPTILNVPDFADTYNQFRIYNTAVKNSTVSNLNERGPPAMI